VLGTVGGLLGVARGVADVPWWGWALVLAAVFIAYRFVAGSFVAKRGLMLGGAGDDAGAPALLLGSGVYGLERDVFGPLDINRSELPLDLVLADLFIALLAAPFFAMGFWWVGLFVIGLLPLNTVAYWRRRNLRRL
jgi:hypothetical protein